MFEVNRVACGREDLAQCQLVVLCQFWY